MNKPTEKKVKATSDGEKSVMEELRKIRDALSLEIKDMSFEELKKFLTKQKTLHAESSLRKSSAKK